jgi:hypothetical protein
MSIRITNLTVQNSAPSGTVIGALTAQNAGTVIPCAYSLTKGSAGLFAIAGNQLVTSWSRPITPGRYSVHVNASGINTGFSASTDFVVDVTAVDLLIADSASIATGPTTPPPPPPPPSGPVAEWTLTQASVSGATVADASGNGNAATVVNGPLTFGAMGANFNGNQCLDSPLKPYSASSSKITVSLWFNAASLAGVPGSSGGGGNPWLVANSHTDVDAKGFQLMFQQRRRVRFL